MSENIIKIEGIILLAIKPNVFKCKSTKVPEAGEFRISKNNEIMIDTDLKCVGDEGFIEMPYWLAEKIEL